MTLFHLQHTPVSVPHFFNQSLLFEPEEWDSRFVWNIGARLHGCTLHTVVVLTFIAIRACSPMACYVHLQWTNSILERSCYMTRLNLHFQFHINFWSLQILFCPLLPDTWRSIFCFISEGSQSLTSCFPGSSSVKTMVKYWWKDSGGKTEVQ